MAHQTVQGSEFAPRSERSRSQSTATLRQWARCWLLGVTFPAVTLAGPAWGQTGDALRRVPAPGGIAVAQQPAPVPAPRPTGNADALPAPRPTSTLGTMHPRLEGLPAGTLAPVGTTPRASREVQEKFGRFVGTFVDPESNIELVVGRPRLLNLKETPFRIQVADERVLSYTLVTPREMSLQGNGVGSTIFNLWFGDPNDPTKQTILSYLVHVLPDPEAKERLERVYKALEEEVNRAFPDAYVCLFLVGDKLVVTGEAKDTVEASRIINVIRSNAPAGRVAGIPVGQVNLNLNLPPDAPPGAQPQQALENYLISGEPNIVNLLRIPGEQQVMLKVTVAEISRTAARSIGINFQVNNNQGAQVFAQNTGGLLLSSFGGGNTNQGGGGGGIANLPVVIDNGHLNLAIQALRNVSMARSLAEPNLVTLNGQTATFFAGGEFPVPVVTGATATGLQGTSFVPFGVTLNFTPVITDKDRIRLQLNATVSTRDVAIGASIGGSGVSGLNSRNISTTVEMREGQTLAIGGLLQTNVGGQTSRVPLLGDLPFGGQLFRSDSTSGGESELVLLVTPQLVHPMEPSEIPALPGSDYFEPGDLEFFLLGRLESRRSYDYRSPVMNNLSRMAAYRHCELLYFAGPHGHCDNKQP